MLQGLTVILSILLAAEGLSRALGLPIPGNVLGMLILFAGLSTGLIRLEVVETAAEALLGRMLFFIVPVMVGIVAGAEILGQEWLAFTLATILSTLLVMAISAWIVQASRGWRDGGA